ncbi:hypothetical protein SAMN03080601_00283 [Alkalitalea saponilacus]|uniref:Uncharacterized protein n=1 Tax=Alkalitalea saponilacus TaxID=889453 RepID=A0A1T5AIE0_9BACT|nr:hypothetical protein SAMN03080601_00283 [Alkalitalea saponilacus]
MEHLTQILWLASFPVLIYVGYKLSLYALKLFHKNYEKDEETE